MALNQRVISFYNKRIWIIGASSGIGEACAKAFLSHGAKVALSARRIDKLKAIQEKWPNDQTLCLPANAQSNDELSSAYQSIKQTWGGIDLLLYVSGIYEPMRADNFDLAKATDIINTNIIGAMSACSITLPDFIQQQSGGIAIVSSVAGYLSLIHI